MQDLAALARDVAAEHGCSAVARVDRGDAVELELAVGLADRANDIPITPSTIFGVASATKGLTALAVMSLVADGTLELSTPVRKLLRGDLPLVDDAVTVAHLLTHRSGIGDYFDEDVDVDITEHILRVPPHELETTEAYVRAIDGFPAKFAPDTAFSYSNGGYVVLALVAERASGIPFPELVHRRVCGPAGMVDTAFRRSDEPCAGMAVGYLPIEGRSRTNVFHLPVVGSGDGGASSTAADVLRLWRALFAGAIVPPERVAMMLRPWSVVPSEQRRYGMGFWLHETKDVAILEGYDAGVSFRSLHDPSRALTCTVLSNTSDGAWPLARALATALDL